MLMLGLALSGCASTSIAQSVLPRSPEKASASASPTAQAPARPHIWQSVGDVDGDGNSDRARIVNLHHASSASSIFGWTYRLDVRLSGSSKVAAAFVGDPSDPASPAWANTHVLGGSDLTGDRRREVFVQVAHGASTAVVSQFRLLDRRLVQMTKGSTPVTLDVYGSVTHLDGFACHPPLLVIWGATATSDGKAYQVTWDRYRVSGATLLLLSSRHRRVPAAQVQGDTFIRCVGLPAAA